MVIGTSEDVKNKILVVSSLEDTRSLIAKILGKDDLTFKSIYSDEIQTTDWQIDTKYYTADVEFWVLNQSNYPPTQLPVSTNVLGDLCEALILVFDATKRESFEKLRGWAEFVNEYAPSVLLCVGVGKSENRSVYNEWCIDNGLEFVEIIDQPEQQDTSAGASTSTTTSIEGDDDAEDDEEEDDRFVGSEGKERIIEALGATMWENLKQKPRSSGGFRFENELAGLSLEDDDDEIPALAGAAPTFDPLNFDEDLRLAHGEFRHATEEISQNMRALQGFLREIEHPPREGSEGNVGDAEDLNSTETQVENFESALTGLRRLRENAQHLPDAQRKALAAQVISMLFPDEEDWQ